MKNLQLAAELAENMYKVLPLTAISSSLYF